MSPPVRIAVDVMGGDFNISVAISAIAKTALRYPSVEFLIFGDSKKITPLMHKRKHLKQKAMVFHAASEVMMDDLPVVAFRQRKDSSMRLAINAVAEGRADAAVSAGNTGALMTMSKIVLKMATGIHRPAMATILPSCQGDVVLMDLGANIDCSADILIQYMMMGKAFVQCSLGVSDPSIGLLNIGTEIHKGNSVLREVDQRMRGGETECNYYGFIEGDDILLGTVDVAVTDGFTGNVALKVIEGTAKVFLQKLRNAYRSSWLSFFGALLSNGALQIFRRSVDPRRYNGAIFLGLNGVVVKSHGSTDTIGFTSALILAIDAVRNKMLSKINKNLELTKSSQTKIPE